MKVENREPGPLPSATVVVPAYNAEATIDDTLTSIRRQSERNIEILLVDDGSTDGTVSRARLHAEEDERIRIIQQSNAGVAAARNRGILEAASEFVAPCDADDIWLPEKIERQLAQMKASPDLALTFTRYWSIDELGRRRFHRPSILPSRTDFRALCMRNFIGNGSSAMMRRSVALDFGGYDSSLRERKAQGCEDLKLYLQIAEKFPIAAANEPLTGYRETSTNMSSDVLQMLRSFDLVAEEFYSRTPDLVSLFKIHRSYMLAWLINRAVDSGNWYVVAKLLKQMVRRATGSPALALTAFGKHFVARRMETCRNAIGLRGKGLIPCLLA